jgi:hypothetical protein
MKRLSLYRSTLALIVLATSHSALAATGYCSLGASNGLSTANMSLVGSNADDCYGVVSGNDNLAAINALNWGSNWSFVLKQAYAGQTATGSFSGLDFSLIANAGKTGTWTLRVSDSNGVTPLNLPAELDLVAVLKAGNGYAAYLFDDTVLGVTNSGQWSVNFLNNGDQIPDLSHISLYARIDGDHGIPSAVPEANTYAMMLCGLGLIGLLTRRQTQG